ncbi:LysR family transcriptional regulator [Sphingomonas sp. HF-S4]|uniref:LysR family transcriptional regulator n=1 Tax=Sphingomonas agrestis TaxID=3080540 RepID=A0ABU3Y984_9SPHN|nr:LysR family transcriptional regulator [Sphingomonas sp. HF-S4]MDV3457946.1 LysR family transcriptional regulator [Sphingomonas sp. HF-S4]
MRVHALKLKLQIVCGDSYAIGPGKADVLEAIDREGSISAAGRALGMSYRRTWLLVDEMNCCFVNRLVETRAGGGDGRGAHLTEDGRLALAAFRELEAQAAALVDAPAYQRLLGRIRVAPDRTKRTG